MVSIYVVMKQNERHKTIDSMVHSRFVALWSFNLGFEGPGKGFVAVRNAHKVFIVRRNVEWVPEVLVDGVIPRWWWT